MALSETSPLDAALMRIIGEPPATPLIPPAQAAPKTSVNLGPAATSAALGAPQPVTPVPAAPVYTPAAAPAAAPVAAPVPDAPDFSGFVRPSKAPASTESTTISRQALYDRQRQEQQNNYMANYNQQLETAAALNPGFKPGPTPTFSGPGPTNFTAAYGGEMIANPYYTAPVAPAGPELTGRAYLGQIGVTPQAFRTMARPERQALRGQYQTALAGLNKPAV
jgi:hypothetical protein